MSAAYLIGYVATIQTRPMFAPDTRYYAGMALWFSGDSQQVAAKKVAEHSALSGWESPPADILFGWGLTQPRVVYPGLSTPFVKLFGIDGLIVVPGIAMALLVAVLTVMIARRWGNVAAVATVLLICISPRLMFYGSAMLTESLSALWGALLLVVAWRYARTPSVWGVIGLFGLTVVAGFTRQATLIPAGAFVMAWFCALVLRHRPNPWGMPALVVGTTAVGIQLLQTWLFPTFSQANQFKAKTGADTLGEAILKAPSLAKDILVVDVRAMAHADHALLVLLALALISMVLFWRHSEAHLLLGALLAYELYNVTNGTPTAFRYGMPGLVFVACSVALLISACTTRIGAEGAPGGSGGATRSGGTSPPEPGRGAAETTT